MSEYFDLTLDAGTGIAELVLNRPQQMNTMTPAFFPAVRDAVRRLNDEGLTRVLVVRSTGKHFSAGMSLDVFTAGFDLLHTDSARQRLAFQDALMRLVECFDVIDRARFPVICAVQGGCIGGGLDLAAACDIRLCTADAFFTVQEIHIGMMADLGSLQRLPKIVPQAIAREMAYTGARLGAERALQAGLVNAVLPDADALAAAAAAMARDIAAKSPLAVAASKLALNHARDHGTAESLAQMAMLQSAVFDIGEMGKAIVAWKSKGVGDWQPLEPVKPV